MVIMVRWKRNVVNGVEIKMMGRVVERETRRRES